MKKIVSWLAGLALTGAVLVAGIGLFWFFGSTNYLLTGVPVLNYHQVNDKFQTVLTMTPADFAQRAPLISGFRLGSNSRTCWAEISSRSGTPFSIPR